MTDLSDWTDSLRRAVATPGDFATFFPDTGDDDLAGSLADAFAECQLDGFFRVQNAKTLDTDANTITPDMEPSEMALVIIYATVRFIRSVLLNRNTHTRYESKGSIAETEQGTSMLTELMKEVDKRKNDILIRYLTYGAGFAFHMADAYYVRATTNYGPLAMWEAASLYDYFDPLGV